MISRKYRSFPSYLYHSMFYYGLIFLILLPRRTAADGHRSNKRKKSSSASGNNNNNILGGGIFRSTARRQLKHITRLEKRLLQGCPVGMRSTTARNKAVAVSTTGIKKIKKERLNALAPQSSANWRDFRTISMNISFNGTVNGGWMIESGAARNKTNSSTSSSSLSLLLERCLCWSFKMPPNCVALFPVSNIESGIAAQNFPVFCRLRVSRQNRRTRKDGGINDVLDKALKKHDKMQKMADKAASENCNDDDEDKTKPGKKLGAKYAAPWKICHWSANNIAAFLRSKLQAKGIKLVSVDTLSKKTELPVKIASEEYTYVLSLHRNESSKYATGSSPSPPSLSPSSLSSSLDKPSSKPIVVEYPILLQNKGLDVKAMRSLASELRQMPNITRTLMRKRTKVVGNSNKDTQLLELSVDEDKSENRVYINIVAT
mmetsp:Transcript_44229/g.73745  ORF Transcript_44229/g.73745 Transcript_44229/m.73745 type:complete len:431 (+) Transcript_44229:216-1508(+)